MTIYNLTFTGVRWMLTSLEDRGPVDVYSNTGRDEAIVRASARLAGTGAALRIHRRNGTLEEERTFPRQEARQEEAALAA